VHPPRIIAGRLVALGPQLPVDTAVLDPDGDDPGLVADRVEAPLEPGAEPFGVEVEGAEGVESEVGGEGVFTARVADLQFGVPAGERLADDELGAQVAGGLLRPGAGGRLSVT